MQTDTAARIAFYAWTLAGVCFALHHACEVLDWVFVWRRERIDLGAIARNAREPTKGAPASPSPEDGT